MNTRYLPSSVSAKTKPRLVRGFAFGAVGRVRILWFAQKQSGGLFLDARSAGGEAPEKFASDEL